MRGAGLLLVLGLYSGVAPAAPSTFQFEGQVVEVDPGAGIFDPSIMSGTPVSASFTVDPALLTGSQQLAPLIPFAWFHLGVIVSGEVQVGPQTFPILSTDNLTVDDEGFVDFQGPFDSWSTNLGSGPTPQAAVACLFELDLNVIVNPALFLVPPFEEATFCRASIRIPEQSPTADLLKANLSFVPDDPDRDGDGVADDVDVCPDWPDPDQLDADDNGTGDLCECGDQDGNGTLNIVDILAINRAIFGLEEISDLCDANDDGLCNVGDILAVNASLFGAPTHCERSPAP